MTNTSHNRTNFRVTYCIFITLIGVLGISFTVYLVVSHHAGTPTYWTIASVLFAGWLFSLGNMWRIAIGRMEKSK